MHFYIILSGLITLIVLSPIAIGSVYIVTYSAMETIVFGLLLLHIWTADFSSRKSGFKVQSSKFKVKKEDNSARLSSHDGGETQGSKQQKDSAIDIDNSQFAIRNSQRFGADYLRNTLLLMLPMAIFLAIVLFQLIPLPLPFIRTLSPQTAALYGKLASSLNTLVPVWGQHSTLNAFPFYPLSMSVHHTSIAFLKWCAYVGAFFLVATFRPERGKMEKNGWIKVLLIALFLMGFAEAIYGLYLYLNHSDTLLWFKRKDYLAFVDGTYINKNHFAGMMGMSIFISFGIFGRYFGTAKMKGISLKESIIRAATTKRTLFVYFTLFGALTMILALTFSNSRMGQFSFVGGFLTFCLLYMVTKLRISLLLLIVIIGLSASWAGWKGLNPVINRWSAAENDFQGRADVWESTGNLICDFRLFGTGLGTYELSNPPYKPLKLGAIIMDHAHSDYLEILSETGITGFVAWAAFFAFFLCFAIRAWLRRRDIVARVIGAGGIAATMTMLIHALADFNLQIPANALLLYIVMGLTWRTLHTSFQV